MIIFSEINNYKNSNKYFSEKKSNLDVFCTYGMVNFFCDASIMKWSDFFTPSKKKLLNHFIVYQSG